MGWENRSRIKGRHTRLTARAPHLCPGSWNTHSCFLHLLPHTSHSPPTTAPTLSPLFHSWEVSTTGLPASFKGPLQFGQELRIHVWRYSCHLWVFCSPSLILESWQATRTQAANAKWVPVALGWPSTWEERHQGGKFQAQQVWNVLYGSVFAGHASRLQNVLGRMRGWEMQLQRHHGTLWSGFLTFSGDSQDPEIFIWRLLSQLLANLLESSC